MAGIVIVRQVLSQEVLRLKAGSCKAFHIMNNSRAFCYNTSSWTLKIRLNVIKDLIIKQKKNLSFLFKDTLML